MPDRYSDAILKHLASRGYHPLKQHQLARQLGVVVAEAVEAEAPVVELPVEEAPETPPVEAVAPPAPTPWWETPSTPVAEAAVAEAPVEEESPRSEERRVGKEGRSRWSPSH